MLSIRNLTKTYRGGKVAVSNLSLEVKSGDIFGFIGHNGAGKTTTIKSVVGIIDFEEGDILIDGVSVRADPISCKKKTAYLPDNPDLYEYLTGIQYLTFMADVFGVSKKDRERLIGTHSDGFDLTSSLGDLISSYSHGMKQKLAIIGALIHSPGLMVLDEPFVGLDPKAIVYLKDVMHALCAEGTAIFFSTHVLDVAEKLCSKVAIIKEGRLVAEGRTEELRGDKSLESVFMEVVAHAK